MKTIPELDAVKDTAKAVLQNTGQGIDLILAKSADLIELQTAASRKMLERHAAHLEECKKTGSQDQVVALQEKHMAAELEQMRTHADKIEKMTESALGDLSALGENNRITSGEFVADAFDQAASMAKAMGPMGQAFSSFMHGQSEVYRSFGKLFEDSLAAQRANLERIRESVAEASRDIGKG